MFRTSSNGCSNPKHDVCMSKALRHISGFFEKLESAIGSAFLLLSANVHLVSYSSFTFIPFVPANRMPFSRYAESGVAEFAEIIAV